MDYVQAQLNWTIPSRAAPRPTATAVAESTRGWCFRLGEVADPEGEIVLLVKQEKKRL